MAAHQYKYTQLDDKTREIRLVHILPGVWDEPISCELHAISIDIFPIYETLSYVWGDLKTTKPICLHGCVFNVTTNLFAALRRLRLPFQARVIWIDALCVNQLDTNERTKQVILMSSIYERCQRVLMWLGEKNENEAGFDKETIEYSTARLEGFLEAIALIRCRPRSPSQSKSFDDVEQAFAVFHLLSSKKSIRKLPCFYYTEGYWEPSYSCNEAAEGIQRIMSVPYWNRIWIVQEMVLPPAATVVFGSWTLPLTVIADALGAASDFLRSPQTGSEQGMFSQDLTDAFTSVDDAISIVRRIQAARQTGGKSNLLWLLRQCLHRDATDPRDKTYGLLGLVSEWYDDSRVLPDYMMTTYELYKNLTIFFIKSSKSFEILVGDCIHNEDFPSWVAHWGQTPSAPDSRYDIGRVETYQFYAATKSNPIVCELLPHSMLRVEVGLVSSVTAIGPLIDYYDDYELYDTCNEALKAVGVRIDSSQLYPDGNTWENACWRTICGDAILDTLSEKRSYRRIRSEDRYMYERWRALCTKQFDDMDEAKIDSVKDYMSSIARATTNRIFFVTENGYLGLGPKQMRVGDEVHVMNGARVPFLLRKVEKPESYKDIGEEGLNSQYPMFHLVGDCYVHGIMDGEACGEAGESTFSIVLC